MSGNNFSVKKYTVALYLGAMIFNMCVNLTGSCLNNIMTDYDIPLSSGGFMSFFQNVGGVALIIIFSRITNVMKKPILLMIAFAIAGIMLFSIGSFPTFVLFILLYVIFGASLSMIDTFNNGILPDLYPQKMNAMLCLLHGICGIGACFIPIITATVGTSNWKSIYKGVAVVAIVVVILQLSMYKKEQKSLDSVYDKPEEKAQKLSVKELLSDKNIRFGMISLLCFGLSQGGIMSWVVKYNTEVFSGMSSLKWALGLTTYWLGATLCRLSLGLFPALKKIDMKKRIVIGGIAAGVVLLAGNLSGNYYGFMLGVFLYGILNAATLPDLVSIMSEWYPQNTGLCSSVAMIALYGGFAIVALVMGIVASAFGMVVMMIIPAAATILSGLAAIPVSRKQ